LPWLFAGAGVSLAHAQIVKNGGNGGAVALAPRLTYTGGLTARWRGIKAALRVRGLGDRPAGETTTAQGYAVVDAFVGYERPRWEGLVAIGNLFDTEWREGQVPNRSCARAENANVANPCFVDPATGMRPRGGQIVSDVHFTPGNPINAMATLRLYF